MSGCRSAEQKRYRAAEHILAENKPDLASAEYERFIEDFPKHALAADACYKLAYLRRTHGDDAEGAVAAYQMLADEYGTSRYADDALQWIAWIGRDQADIPRIRDAVRRLETEHADEPGSCARARVQLALALLEAGSEDVKAQCETIQQRYPSQARQCAQAQLILARALEKFDEDGDAAVKQYEKVMKEHPQTTSAVEARQRIGLLFYGQSQDEPEKPTEAAPPPATKVIEGVPPFALGPETGIQRLTLEALRSLLSHKGVEADMDTLMAVSGIAFQFVYSPSDRMLGVQVFAAQPFETTCAGFGFVARENASETADRAILKLCQALDLDEPVLVPYADQVWVIVTSYDQGSKQLTYLRPGTADTRAAEFDEFSLHWQQAADQWGGALLPYYQLSLGLRQRQPATDDLVREGAKRAVSLMARRSVLGAPAGPAAYEALIADLEAHATESIPEDARDLAQWAGSPLVTLRNARRSAASFLDANAGSLPEAAAASAIAAASTYRALDSVLASLQANFPVPPTGADPNTPSPEYAAAALEAVALARDAQALDAQAAGHLALVVAE